MDVVCVLEMFGPKLLRSMRYIPAGHPTSVPERGPCNFLECLPVLARIGPSAVEIAPDWQIPGRCLPKRARQRPNSVGVDQACPNLEQIRSTPAALARNRPNLGRPIRGRFLPTLAKLCVASTKHGSDSTKCDPNSTSSGSISTTVRPISTTVDPTWAKSGPKLTKVGSNCTKFDQHRLGIN